MYGTFKGRLGHSSPEQVRCEQVDRRTDVYSLGILLYELTTGRAAITGADEKDLIANMEAAQIVPPRELDPSYPRDLESVVMRACARDREQRYATTEELQHELEVFADRHALHTSELAISRLMNQMFAHELEPWHRARDSGRTLEEHMITLHTYVSALDHSFEELPTHRRPSKPRRELDRVIRIAIVLALFGAAYFVARWWFTVESRPG
jgi:eukaryotic-like serine/threonine-protein kinase